MKPIGHLMWRYRLIEKILASLSARIDKIEKNKKINPVIIDIVVHFIRTYADRTHQGKEEGILFRDLAKKELTPELEKIMQELINEHV
jgi:hemerythrin-like domain-containing protein